jgi:hypothetical protein
MCDLFRSPQVLRAPAGVTLRPVLCFISRNRKDLRLSRLPSYWRAFTTQVIQLMTLVIPEHLTKLVAPEPSTRPTETLMLLHAVMEALSKVMLTSIMRDIMHISNSIDRVPCQHAACRRAYRPI